MSNHHRSLNACIRVPPLLDLLGCRTRVQGLPLRTRCPVCRDGVLTIYRDHASGGAWHECRECDRRGDLIALTAAALGVSLPEAIVHLSARGFGIATDDASIRRYQQEHVDYDTRLAQLWARTTTSQAPLREDFARIAHRLGLNPGDWGRQWRKGIGQIIGRLTKTDVESTFAPQVMESARARAKVRGITGSTSGYRTFPGPDWDVVASVPFFDLPGRISSMLFVGRDANPQHDFVLRRANRGTLGNQHLQVAAEAGLAFHPEVFHAGELKHRTLLAIHDPMQMLKLQARHLAVFETPLPTVSWVDSDQWPNWQTLGRRTRTQSAWQMLCGYKIVFWAPFGIDIYTLRQAIATEGWISTAGPRVRLPYELAQYMWRRPASDLWKHIVEQARPWPDAVNDDLSHRKNAELDRWLVKLEHEQEPLDRILRRCNPETQERIQGVVSVAAWPRTMEFNGRTILEANRSWWFQRNGRPGSLICDAILRIDRVVRDEDAGQDCLRGRILFGESSVPVYAPVKTFEKKTFEYMRGVLLDAGLGLLRFDPRYSRYGLEIAAGFQPPQPHEPLARVGFDQGTEKLVLPIDTIELGGEVHPTTGLLASEHVPATNLPPVVAASAKPLCQASLLPPVAGVVWATLACVIANVLAGEFEDGPAGTCLVGQGAQDVGTAVCEAAGCVRLRVDKSTDVAVALYAVTPIGLN